MLLRAPDPPKGPAAIPLPTQNTSVHSFFVSNNGKAYISLGGDKSDGMHGTFVTTSSAASCESSPKSCSWKPINSGAPVASGEYVRITVYMDIDATHIFALFGFSFRTGQCPDCSAAILDTATNAWRTLHLPGIPMGQSPVCATRDSAGIAYVMTNYGGLLWKSTDSSDSSFRVVTPNYTRLPGLSGTGGNIYTCKALGSRLYFGGEGGVKSCDLSFKKCSDDFLPLGTPEARRNLLFLLADVDGGSPVEPTLMLETDRHDRNAPNLVCAAIRKGPYGTPWTMLDASSGITPYKQSSPFDQASTAYGKGTARRYYFTTLARAPFVLYKSADATMTHWVSYKPPELPESIGDATTGELFGPVYIQVDPLTGALWVFFSGKGCYTACEAHVSPGIYIVPGG